METGTLKILGGARGGGRRSHFFGDFIAVQKPFESLKKAPKQTLFYFLTSEMLDVAHNFMVMTSCTKKVTTIIYLNLK